MLKELVVSGEADLIVQAQLSGPKRQSRLNGFRGKSGTDGDRAIVEGHANSIMPEPRDAPHAQFFSSTTTASKGLSIMFSSVCLTGPPQLASPALCCADVGLAVRRHARVLVRQVDDHAIEDVLVQRRALVRPEVDAEHAHLRILELHVVVLGVDLERVERRSWQSSSGRRVS